VAVAPVAAAAWVPAGVRLRAEALVREVVRDLRLGDKITLARLATASVLPLLLVDEEPRVVEAALQNPRLREEDLVTVLRRDDAPKILLETCAASSRWSLNYATRLALVLQPRTPLAVALGRMALARRAAERAEQEQPQQPIRRPRPAIMPAE